MKEKPLIVPYGIEITHVIDAEEYGATFNRTIWN